jgi:SecD/SecF fusion protein
MQNKGAIRLFAILLALVCIYQLSFTLKTYFVEQDAKEFAGGDPKKEKAYLDSVAGQPVYNLLLKKYTYKECKEREINLGLDLKGGMNVTLEVSMVDLIRSMSNYNTDEKFNKALVRATEMQKSSQDDYVTLFGKAFEEVNPGAKLSAIFNTVELKNKVKYESTNEEVIKVIREEAKGAFDRSFNILRTRIDKFGVTQPNIQKLDASGRILVELPGVKEPERVRKLLQGTANLEFWETFENAEVAGLLDKANTKLANIKAGKTENDSTAASKDSTATASAAVELKDSAKADKKGAEGLLTKLDNKEKTDTGVAAKAGKAGSIKDTSAAAKNPLFSVLQPSVYQNDKGMYLTPGPVVGIVALKDTGKVNALLNMPEIKSLFPRNLRLLWSVKAFDKAGNFVQLVAIKVSSRDGRAPLDGSVIVDATGDYSQSSSAAEVGMTMNGEGAALWKRLTADNIGKSVAIVLDNYVYSFPTVQSEISGGRSQITGNFDINEAKDLANILKAGKMPAPARIVSEAIVGPSLGQEAINAGLASFAIALILVLIFMGIYYNKAGWIADIALFANLFFIMGVLASLGAVLTLPGIAGMVLTIGLSVDANILVFERIREELNSGASTSAAIREGFKGALSSIIDSNVTTLILGVILYIFGSGPIQGFATTLIIGICTSLFSALFITRLIFEYLLVKESQISFYNDFSKNAFKNLKFNFVGNRIKYYIFSGLIIVAGVVGLFTNGLNFGIDFKGGRSYVVRFEKSDVTSSNIREVLAGPLSNAPEVKTYGSSNQLKITTTYLISENSQDVDSKVEKTLTDALNAKGLKHEIMSSQRVGENISDDIKQGAVWSILIGCALMFVFIVIRFSQWQFGLGAVVALLHDVLVVLSVFAILNGVVPFALEIDQHFIAAILTVMGYSMTDTVVVFDRIREYLHLNNKTELSGNEKRNVINDALNNTLSRTLITSLTIFLVLLAIFLFGGEVIRGFSFALLIGIVIGTYSSLCIATPVVVDFEKKAVDKN